MISPELCHKLPYRTANNHIEKDLLTRWSDFKPLTPFSMTEFKSYNKNKCFSFLIELIEKLLNVQEKNSFVDNKIIWKYFETKLKTLDTKRLNQIVNYTDISEKQEKDKLGKIKRYFGHSDELSNLNQKNCDQIYEALIKITDNLDKKIKLREKPYLHIFKDPEDGEQIVFVNVDVQGKFEDAYSAYNDMLYNWWFKDENEFSDLVTINLTGYGL
jgi:hypothetical protein